MEHYVERLLQLHARGRLQVCLICLLLMATFNMLWIVGYGRSNQSRDLALVDAANTLCQSLIGAVLSGEPDPEQSLEQCRHVHAMAQHSTSASRRFRGLTKYSYSMQFMFYVFMLVYMYM